MALINDLEYKQLKKIINISKMGEDLYLKLYNIELNNSKNTLEYQKYLEYLKIVLEMEKEEYLRLNLDQDKISRYLYYINKEYYIDKELGDLESIIEDNFEKRIIKRVVARLIYYVPSKNDILIYFLNEEIEDSIKKVLNKNKIGEVDLNKYLDDVNIINTNLYCLFLNNIYQAYLDKNNTFIKDELLKTYYNIIYLKGNIENKMLNNNFNLNENLTLDAKLIQKDKLFSLSYNLINKLLNISDTSFSFKKTIKKVIISECLLRSCLYLIEEDDYEILYNYYLDIINDLKYQNKNDKIGKSIVLNSFNLTKKENNKLKV